MGVLDFFYIETVGVKSPGHKKIFCLLSDTLLWNIDLIVQLDTDTPREGLMRQTLYQSVSEWLQPSR